MRNLKGSMLLTVAKCEKYCNFSPKIDISDIRCNYYAVEYVKFLLKHYNNSFNNNNNDNYTPNFYKTIPKHLTKNM